MQLGLSARAEMLGCQKESWSWLSLTNSSRQNQADRAEASLLGQTLPGKSPDHRACTAIQRELRKVSRRTGQNGHG